MFGLLLLVAGWDELGVMGQPSWVVTWVSTLEGCCNGLYTGISWLNSEEVDEQSSNEHTRKPTCPYSLRSLVLVPDILPQQDDLLQQVTLSSNSTESHTKVTHSPSVLIPPTLYSEWQGVTYLMLSMFWSCKMSMGKSDSYANIPYINQQLLHCALGDVHHLLLLGQPGSMVHTKMLVLLQHPQSGLNCEA
ncbi:hypothetical protein EV401DRAFT_1890600 [Pisolithus croceorrhizus]|nr:hypothetical protein EV401DRAFT_1890600 [Pisolithus croceorrhizus]